MKRTLFGCAILLSMLLSACNPPAPTGQDLPLTAKRGVIRVEMPADVDVADVPLLMAFDSLSEQGYELETVSLADTAVLVSAIAQGDLDIAGPNNQQAWAAIGQGAPFFTFMDLYANTFLVISGQDIRTCADLDGKSLAVPTVRSVSEAMFNVYAERNCPGVKPQTVIISGGSSRTAALLAGEVDAAIQDIDDLLMLERERPGEFHALISFAEELPGLQIYSLLVNRDFAAQRPEMVKEVIRAVLIARRAVQDPQVLREAVVQYVGVDPESAQHVAEVYLAHKIWDASGTYTMETVQANLGFLQEYGNLPPELQAQEVADLSYYETVLDEIGRQ